MRLARRPEGADMRQMHILPARKPAFMYGFGDSTLTLRRRARARRRLASDAHLDRERARALRHTTRLAGGGDRPLRQSLHDDHPARQLRHRSRAVRRVSLRKACHAYTHAALWPPDERRSRAPRPRPACPIFERVRGPLIFFTVVAGRDPVPGPVDIKTPILRRAIVYRRRRGRRMSPPRSSRSKHHQFRRRSSPLPRTHPTGTPAPSSAL